MSILAQVDPFAKGIPWSQWFRWDMTAQCEDYLRTITASDRAKAPINEQRIFTPRDGYGMKALPASADKRRAS